MNNGIDARKEKFQVVTVFGEKMLFTNARVEPKSVPKGLYHYEVRHSDEDWGEPIQIAEWIRVNLWGTLLSAKPIELEKSPVIDNSYRDIDPETDWNYESYEISVREYLKEYGPKKDKPKAYER